MGEVDRRHRRRPPPRRCDVGQIPELHEQWLPEPDGWFHWCRDALTWQQEWIQLFGQRRRVPRLVYWAGDAGLNYRYSGTDHPCSGWPVALEPLRSWVAEQADLAANFVLMNRYRTGKDSMGWHADDEPELLGDVCSISLGASRRLLLDTPAERLALTLRHGSVIRIPRHWRHAVPKTSQPVGERINLTFRRLRPPEPQ